MKISRGQPIDKGVDVTLTRDEIVRAATIGAQWQCNAVDNQFQHLVETDPRLGWFNNINGAGAELATAKIIGVDWTPGPYTFGRVPDLWPDIEVRLSSEYWYDLRIRDRDYPDRNFVLVLGSMPTFRVVGYINGRDGTVPEYRKDPNGWGEAWFVPQTALRDIYELRDYVKRQEQFRTVQRG